MKRVGYLVTPERITVEYCTKIIRKAAKGKKKRSQVYRIVHNIEHYARLLQSMVLNGTYIASPYKICTKIDKPSMKERLLHQPKFFPDQCVHHILIDLVQEKLTKRIDPYAIASIPKRGIHYGYKAIRKWLRQDVKGTKYCLKCDIRKCYQNIQPKYVVACFEKFIKDKKYLALLKTVAYSMDSLPLGNYTSSWFENLLLLEMDTAVRNAKGINYYLRYVDDFISLSGNKRKLHRIVELIVDMLSQIGLRLKQNWQIFKVSARGIDMLGYRFFYGYTLLRKRNLLGLFRALRKYLKHSCNKTAVSLSCRMGGLIWFDSFNLKNKIYNFIDIIKLRALCNCKYA